MAVNPIAPRPPAELLLPYMVAVHSTIMTSGMPVGVFGRDCQLSRSGVHLVRGPEADGQQR